MYEHKFSKKKKISNKIYILYFTSVLSPYKFNYNKKNTSIIFLIN